MIFYGYNMFVPYTLYFMCIIQIIKITISPFYCFTVCWFIYIDVYNVLTLNNTYTMVLRWDGSSNNESMYIGKIIIQFSCLCKQICFTLHMCVWYLDVLCYIRTMTCTLYQVDPFTLIFELTLPHTSPHLLYLHLC